MLWKIFISEIVKALEKKEKVALATLINRVGSAPRAVGAKYLVKEDGTSFGTIGGGCVEAEVWQGAQEVIKKGNAGVLHFDLTAEQLAAGGLICGGTVDIFLEPLGEGFLDIYREVARIKQKGGSAVLATFVSIDHAPVKGEGTKIVSETVGGENRAFIPWRGAGAEDSEGKRSRIERKPTTDHGGRPGKEEDGNTHGAHRF